MSCSDYVRLNKRQKENKFATKVIVRRLPPNFTWEIFKEQVSPLPEHTYFYFVKADRSDRISTYSRVYINFAQPQDVLTFKEKYDNYVFLGPKGIEYPAVVEFAQFQKKPKERLLQNQDTKCGTIQNNEYYFRFVENLKISKYDSFERPEYDLQLYSQMNERESVTPLLKYISAKKSEQIKGRLDRKREIKQTKSENCMVFINSSVKKTGHQWVQMKKHA